MNDLKYSGELIVLDDASPSEHFRKKNAVLDKLEGVSYIQMEENLGRSKARNRLADEANGAQLLFLDADIDIVNNDFLIEYARFFHEKIVLVGGHLYTRIQPEKKLLLNWNYARKYESKPASLRQKKPYRGFISMNFMIPREEFLDLQFPTELKGWGHEDTLFAHLLEKRGVQIRHIDNPVLHLGLSETEQYLEKQREAIEQALVLIKRYPGFGYRLTEVHNKIPVKLRSLLKLSSGILLPTLSALCRLTNAPLILNAYKLVYYNSVFSR
jgi:glycosyltransferase involved in cell wall biosynthesis